MWSAHGQRVTASPAFMPDAPADVRALYRRHARGNSLFRNLGDGRFEDVTVEARADDGPLGVVVRRARLRQRRLGGPLRRQRHADARRRPEDLEGFFWRQVVARSPLTRVKGTPYDDAWRAINQLLIHDSIASQQRNVFLRNDGQGGFDDVSGTVGLDLDQDGRSFAVLDVDRDGDPDLAVMAARQAPQLRVFRNDFSARGRGVRAAPRRIGQEQPRRGRGARRASRPTGCAGRRSSGRLRLPVAALEGAALRARREHGHPKLTVDVAVRRTAGLHRRAAGHPAAARRGRPLESEPFAPASAAPATAPAAPAPRAIAAGQRRGSTSRSRRRPSRSPTSRDRRARCRRWRGKPALLLFWSATDAAGARRARRAGARRDALDRAGVARARHRHDRRPDAAAPRAAAPSRACR